MSRIESAKSWIRLIISGDILLRLKVHKLFPFIFYLFMLGWLNILMNYQVEQDMALAEKNREELETLKIYHAQKTCEYVSLDRISTIEGILKDMNSELKAPEKPADIIKE